MTELKQIVLTLSVAMVVLGFASKLFPANSLRGNVKTLLSVLLMLIIISPLSKARLPELKSPIGDSSFSTPTHNDYVDFTVRGTIHALKLKIKQAVTEQGVDFYDVVIKYENHPEGIEIICAEVYIKSGYSAVELKQNLEQSLSVPIEVTVGSPQTNNAVQGGNK